MNIKTDKLKDRLLEIATSALQEIAEYKNLCDEESRIGSMDYYGGSDMCQIARKANEEMGLLIIESEQSNTLH